MFEESNENTSEGEKEGEEQGRERPSCSLTVSLMGSAMGSGNTKASSNQTEQTSSTVITYKVSLDPQTNPTATSNYLHFIEIEGRS